LDRPLPWVAGEARAVYSVKSVVSFLRPKFKREHKNSNVTTTKSCKSPGPC
jgi:hypothetical protein